MLHLEQQPPKYHKHIKVVINLEIYLNGLLWKKYSKRNIVYMNLLQTCWPEKSHLNII